MYRRANYAGGWIWILFVVSSVGCNRGLDLVPVEGTVTYEGSPLAKAGVLFTPTQGPPAMGSTDQAGKFTLSTANQQGAFVGEYRVTVSKTNTTSVPAFPYPIPKVQYLIPRKYSNPQTSGLTATVVDDDNRFEFNLTK